MALNKVGESLNVGTDLASQTGVAAVAATAGRLLFAHLAITRGTGTLTDANFSTGWTKLGFQTGSTTFNYGGALAYRYATGDANDNCQATFVGAECRFMMNVVEDDSGISGTPQAFVSAGLNSSAASVGCGLITPGAQPATVFTFASVREWDGWMSNLTGDGMTIGSGFTKDYTAGQGSAGNVLPGCASAHLDITDLNAVNPVWSTSEGGSTACAFGVIFPQGSAGTEWLAEGVQVDVDQPGVFGEPNRASRLTCVTPGGTVTAGAHSLAAGTHTGRWFLKALVGDCDCSISLDGGSTWSAVSGIGQGAFTAALQEMVTDAPQLAIKMDNAGDQLVVGNAELHPNMAMATVNGSDPIQTTDEALTFFSKAGQRQSAVWVPEPAWNCEP